MMLFPHGYDYQSCGNTMAASDPHEPVHDVCPNLLNVRRVLSLPLVLRDDDGHVVETCSMNAPKGGGHCKRRARRSVAHTGCRVVS